MQTYFLERAQFFDRWLVFEGRVVMVLQSLFMVKKVSVAKSVFN